jgi:hypothetical protein
MSNATATQFSNPTPVPQPQSVVQSWPRKKIVREMLDCWNGDRSAANFAYIELLLSNLEPTP